MGHTPEKIRVAFILPSLAFGGGIEAHLIRMFEYIDRERFECSLITLFEHPERPDLYGRVPNHVRVVRLASRGIGHPTTWVRTYTALRNIRPHIVVGSMFSPNTLVRALKPILGYAAIAREHNTYDEKRWYHRAIDKILSYVSDAIIAVSSDVADFASRQAGISRERFTVINNGVDVERIETFLRESGTEEIARVRAELGLREEEKILLNVARIKPTKGHALLVDALEIFLKSHPEYHLVVCGDGSERPNVEQQIERRGLGNRIHMLGYRADVFAWYAAAEVYVLSSKREGFPNVAIEAMAFGLPVVATHVAGIKDIVMEGRNGMLAEASPEAFAAAIDYVVTRLAANPDTIRSSCQTVARKFDIRFVVKEYERLFKKLYEIS